MADDEMPEMPTNEEWRGIMVRARKAHGLTQGQLGEKVGTSQAMISKLESGESTSSTLILPICSVLSIPEPQHFLDEEARHWWELRRVLKRDPERYQAILRTAELMAEQVEEDAAKRGTLDEEDRPERRK